MSRFHRGERHRARCQLEQQVAAKQQRKLQARADQQSVWFGLGMFGLVGWSVAIPAVLGVALGVWIDTRWPSRFSWTLMLLVMGVALGCLNAWWWVSRESSSEPSASADRQQKDEPS